MEGRGSVKAGEWRGNRNWKIGNRKVESQGHRGERTSVTLEIVDEGKTKPHA